MMAQERKNSIGSQPQGTLRDLPTILEKKIRNLEKRKGRLEMVEKELELGQEVSEDRRAALKKMDTVLDMLELCRDFHSSAEQLLKSEDQMMRQKARKEARDQQLKMAEAFAKALRMQWVLEEANARRDELLDGLADEESLKVLESFSTACEANSKRDFRKSAEMWISCVEAKSREVIPGLSYKVVNEKLQAVGDALDKLNSADTQTKESEVGAEGDESCERTDTPDTSVPPSEDLTPEHQDVSPTQPGNDHHPQATNVTHQASQQPIPADHPAVVAIPAAIITPVSILPVSPVAPDEDRIQFGSVEHLTPHSLVALVPTAVPTVTPVTHPNAMFQDREFDFIQEDLLGPQHVDPAVICAGAASIPQQAIHYQQLQYQQQMVQHQQVLAQQQMAAQKQEIQEEAGGQEVEKPREDRRSPNQEGQRNNRGDGENNGKPYYRNMNGHKYVRERWSGFGEGRGNWHNRGGYGSRGSGGYGNGYSQHNGGHPRYHNGGNRTSFPRRDQQSHQQQPQAQRV